MNIAFFDSGIGGLTSLAYFKQLYPLHSYHYFADFAGFPYGNKSYEQLYARCTAVIMYLLTHEVTHIVVACNTATVIVQELQHAFPQITFIFGVDIAIAQAYAVSVNKKIGLFATKYVVNSGMYPAKLCALDEKSSMVQEACPTLAQIIENGNEQEIYTTLAFHTKVMDAAQIDTLILGCTHYGYASQMIKSLLPGVSLVHSDEHYRFFPQEIMAEKSNNALLVIYSSLPFDILCSNVQQKLYEFRADAYCTVLM